MKHELKAFRTACSTPGSAGFPSKARGVAAGAPETSPPLNAGKRLSVGSHMGTSSTRETKPIQPTIYCCTSLLAELRGSSSRGAGRRPRGHRVQGRRRKLRPEARVRMPHGPEASAATLQAGSRGNGVAGRPEGEVVRVQLVTIYKVQQLRACAFTFR